MNPLIKLSLCLAFVCLVVASSGVSAQSKMDSIAKQQVMSMLKNVKNAIKKDYYDPNFGGMDIDARFAVAEEKLKGVNDLSQAFAVIAQAVVDLNDSHTRFYPPARTIITEYGWRMKLIGNKAFITGVKEKSDAEAKGLKIGDEVVTLNGFKPSRTDMWKMIYYYQVLSPQTRMTMDVKSPGGEPRRLEVESNIIKLKKTINLTDSIDLNEAIREGAKLANSERHYFKDFGNTFVWKMPSFVFESAQVGEIMQRANDKRTIILDLRGNGGGYVVTLEKLAGYFFEKDTKIADVKGRKPMDPQMAKSQGADVFKGTVIVLVDANSASAAEIFPRLMQIEKRGTVIGDVTAGAVMQSRGASFDAGADTVISYGMNLTRADVIMTDGKSLEHTGVTPDELMVPTGADLANFRDPVLARALNLSGVSIDADAAGKIFPIEKFIERRTNVALNIEW